MLDTRTRRILAGGLLATLLIAAGVLLFREFRSGQGTSSPAPDVPPWALVSTGQLNEATRLGVPVAIENDLGMRFVLVPAGVFMMGSPSAEKGRREYEHHHSVVLRSAYYVSIHEVTNAQYRAYEPEYDGGVFIGRSLDEERQPAHHLSHNEATAFINWLSSAFPLGVAYRLPTEAEWERACRAGGTGAYPWGDLASEAPMYANENSPSEIEKHLAYPGGGVADGRQSACDEAGGLSAPKCVRAVRHDWQFRRVVRRLVRDRVLSGSVCA